MFATYPSSCCFKQQLECCSWQKVTLLLTFENVYSSSRFTAKRFEPEAAFHKKLHRWSFMWLFFSLGSKLSMRCEFSPLTAQSCKWATYLNSKSNLAISQRNKELMTKQSLVASIKLQLLTNCSVILFSLFCTNPVTRQVNVGNSWWNYINWRKNDWRALASETSPDRR